MYESFQIDLLGSNEYLFSSFECEMAISVVSPVDIRIDSRIDCTGYA
jgi:hypothetical protein